MKARRHPRIARARGLNNFDRRYANRTVSNHPKPKTSTPKATGQREAVVVHAVAWERVDLPEADRARLARRAIDILLGRPGGVQNDAGGRGDG